MKSGSSSLNPTYDPSTEIERDTEIKRVNTASIKPSRNTGTVSVLLPPPSPQGSFDTPLSHLSTSLPPTVSFQPPKYWVIAWLMEGNREPERKRDRDEMLWMECVCIYPEREYIYCSFHIQYLAVYVLAFLASPVSQTMMPFFLDFLLLKYEFLYVTFIQPYWLIPIQFLYYLYKRQEKRSKTDIYSRPMSEMCC